MPTDRRDLNLAVQRLAFEQAGYFTAAQARAVGYSYQAQAYHADAGNWVRVDRGIFRLPGWPAAPDDAYVRWALWSGGRGVLSHESALSVHGLADVNPRLIHLTVPPGFRARTDAVVLHVGRLSDDEVERRAGWALTTPIRSVIDVAGSESGQETVDRAVDDLLERGLATRSSLRAAAVGDRAAERVELAIDAAVGG